MLFHSLYMLVCVYINDMDLVPFVEFISKVIEEKNTIAILGRCFFKLC